MSVPKKEPKAQKKSGNFFGALSRLSMDPDDDEEDFNEPIIELYPPTIKYDVEIRVLGLRDLTSAGIL